MAGVNQRATDSFHSLIHVTCSKHIKTFKALVCEQQAAEIDRYTRIAPARPPASLIPTCPRSPATPARLQRFSFAVEPGAAPAQIVKLLYRETGRETK